jgi:hypothetical protein
MLSSFQEAVGNPRGRCPEAVVQMPENNEAMTIRRSLPRSRLHEKSGHGSRSRPEFSRILLHTRSCVPGGQCAIRLKACARPAVLWRAVVVLVAWLSGGPPALAQTPSASEPWIAPGQVIEPPWQNRDWPVVIESGTPISRRVAANRSHQRQVPHAPRQGREGVSVVADRIVMELPDPASGVPEWQEPSYSPDAPVMEFADPQSWPEDAYHSGCTTCGGACGPPSQCHTWLHFMRCRHPTCGRVGDENLPAWQMPPLPDSPEYPGWTADEGGSGGLLHNRLWGRAEFLLLWGKGSELPALATTSPIGTAQGQAGVLGAPGAALVFGDQSVNSNTRAGGRFTLGWWLCACQEVGIEGTYFTMGAGAARLNASDQTFPILAQPFVNAQTGAQDASLVAYPGLETGTLNITVRNQFDMWGALVRRALLREPKYRVDCLFGFRYARFLENLSVDSHSTSVSATGAVPVGTVTNVSDFFGSTNQFYGADIGIATQSRRGRLAVDLFCKVALGYARSTVSVQGQTATILPSQAPSIYTGGLLALPTNIGHHQLGGFAVLPELGINFEYQLTRRLSATLGYTVVYWSRVARPADQVDLQINASQLPPGQLTGAAAPHFQSVTSDFWLQGMTTGLKYQF